MNRYVKSAVRRVAQYVLGDGAVLTQSTWAGYTRDALQLANIIDCTPAQMQQQQQNPERIVANLEDRICNWYLPQFDNPFYGGVMTILRLSEYLLRTHGIKQRILICGAANKSDVEGNLIRAFPALAQAEVIVLDSVQAIANIPPAEYSVATLWTTAYVLLGVQNTGYKFYMIQDFEPAFYPAGSTYAQAELTYRFGFYGIANTQSIKEIYEKNYGGNAVVLKPNIDRTVFFQDDAQLQANPKRIFYYARPGTPRNGFELAAAALQRLKQKHGDGVDIVCAGAGWNPEEYGLSGVVRSVGMLPYAGTGDLYRSCHIGFVMMMTKHPSYLPFELMACGALVVTNYNEANTWLLKDGENCLLSHPSASSLAQTLSYALEHYDALSHIRHRATDQISADAADWDNSLSEVAKFLVKPTVAFNSHQPFIGSSIATQHFRP